jgi:toxin ParE1/3/4
MAYKIVVTPDAIQNIDDAVYFYKKEFPDRVAKSFINEYKHTFTDIAKTPYFQVFFQDFRGKPKKKFPYIVFYTIDESLKTIIIKAVFHTSQDPKKYPII